MTTALSILRAICASGALVLIGVLIGWATKPSEPPAELVATINGWPPPWTGLPDTVGHMIYDDTLTDDTLTGWPPPRDPWGPPDKRTMHRSCFWQPWMDLPDPTPFYPPPSWQRVGA